MSGLRDGCESIVADSLDTVSQTLFFYTTGSSISTDFPRRN